MLNSGTCWMVKVNVWHRPLCLSGLLTVTSSIHFGTIADVGASERRSSQTGRTVSVYAAGVAVIVSVASLVAGAETNADKSVGLRLGSLTGRTMPSDGVVG